MTNQEVTKKMQNPVDKKSESPLYNLRMTPHTTDRYVITLKTLDDANKVRNAFFTFTPETWVYVVKSMVQETGYDIFISDMFGGYPSDSHYDAAVIFAKKISKTKKLVV